jgi:hypothetical protein
MNTHREEYLAKFGCRLNNEGFKKLKIKLYKNIFLYFWLSQFEPCIRNLAIFLSLNLVEL